MALPTATGERARRGFTLIELLVVLSVIALMLTIAVPKYFASLERAKEAVLREDLLQIREAIQRYQGDKGKYPETLEALATEKYLRKLPVDPITESAESWIIVPPEDPLKGGVYDVKSGATGNGLDGKPYAEW